MLPLPKLSSDHDFVLFGVLVEVCRSVGKVLDHSDLGLLKPPLWNLGLDRSLILFLVLSSCFQSVAISAFSIFCVSSLSFIDVRRFGLTIVIGVTVVNVIERILSLRM